MIVTIKRQDGPSALPYLQSFEYAGSGRQTVAQILDQLNYRDDLFDIEGNSARRIHWECSCMQKMCGACAMVINGMPALACSTFIDTETTQTLLLEPLSKFATVADLAVDRSCIAQHAKDAEMYLGEAAADKMAELDQQYLAAKCLKCGLCLEVCPNYVGEAGTFYGAALANEAFLLHSASNNRKEELAAQYKKHFSRGCSKSLACRSICPVEIPTLSSIGYMNRV